MERQKNERIANKLEDISQVIKKINEDSEYATLFKQEFIKTDFYEGEFDENAEISLNDIAKLIKQETSHILHQMIQSEH